MYRAGYRHNQHTTWLGSGAVYPAFLMPHLPGFAIAVVQDEEAVYLKGLGLADVEAERPFTLQRVAYIASSTRSFAGLAAALLDHEGRWDLDCVAFPLPPRRGARTGSGSLLDHDP